MKLTVYTVITDDNNGTRPQTFTDKALADKFCYDWVRRLVALPPESDWRDALNNWTSDSWISMTESQVDVPHLYQKDVTLVLPQIQYVGGNKGLVDSVRDRLREIIDSPYFSSFIKEPRE